MDELRQTTLVEKLLTIQTVNQYFRDIPSAKGKGSRRITERLIRSLFNQANLLEAKYLARLIMVRCASVLLKGFY